MSGIPKALGRSVWILVLIGQVAWPASTAMAGSGAETAADWLAVLLPVSAAGTTVVLRDWKGTWQFAKSAGVTMGTTYAFKLLWDAGDLGDTDTRDPPSGHTAAAFLGPAFIHHRYGWRYSVPLYAGALFVGYTQADADPAAADDVVFGAAIAMLATLFFTTPQASGFTLDAELRPGGYGLRVGLEW